MTTHDNDRYDQSGNESISAAAVYQLWARWLVEEMGAPWDFHPNQLPPPDVLRLMPTLMYDHDNRTRAGNVIHEDVTREDYAAMLRDEWKCSTAWQGSS